MLDLFFAIVAASVQGSGDGAPNQIAESPAPVVAEQPAETQAPAEEQAVSPVPAEPPTEAPKAVEAAPQTQTTTQGSASVSIAPGSVSVGENVVIGGQVATPPAPAVSPVTQTPQADTVFDMSVVPAGLMAEPQNPTGKFTTATEVKQILGATKANWVAVREYNGQDLVYVTHLWSWRCGLAAMAISLNDEPLQNWPMPPCHTQYSTPNALLDDDPLPYLTLKPGSVQKITIQIVYDDMTMDRAEINRADVLIP